MRPYGIRLFPLLDFLFVVVLRRGIGSAIAWGARGGRSAKSQLYLRGASSCPRMCSGIQCASCKCASGGKIGCGRCAEPSVLIRTSSAKAEASQNRGRSDFQKSYTETLTAKEMGAIVESARVPRIVLA